MIDLHCHILPGIDDGASDISVSLAMARAFVAGEVDVDYATARVDIAKRGDDRPPNLATKCQSVQKNQRRLAFSSVIQRYLN